MAMVSNGLSPAGVVANHSPLMHEFAEIQTIAKTTTADLARLSGVTRETLFRWRQGRTPGLANFDAVLRVMGYELAIVPMSTRSPQPDKRIWGQTVKE